MKQELHGLALLKALAAAMPDTIIVGKLETYDFKDANDHAKDTESDKE